MKKLSLDRTQLKILAIIAMVVDHTAWGFVDFLTPLGQGMHIFGRLTLPIMCYFVAEGYRHTKSLQQYIMRMASFAVLSMVPFYVFFHEEYYFRQNIIFDLLLALLALSAMEYEKWSKPLRYTVVGLIVVVSLLIGGWVVMPIVYVLIFYYSPNLKDAAKQFVIATVIMEVALIFLIEMNHIYHYSIYDWSVKERLYLVFFVIALIPLHFYNGKKGSSKVSNYFFYFFYPAHFIVLAYIKYLMHHFSWQNVYIHAHVVSLAIGVVLMFYVLFQKPSRAQVSVTFFLALGVMYVYGFLMEITTHEVAGVYTATKLQYFALALVLMAITYCNQELCHVKIPVVLYCAEAVVSIVTIYYLFTFEQNGMFYSDISVNMNAGPFPRMEIEGYGPAFYGFLLYTFIICAINIGIGMHSAIHGTETQKKRLRLLLYAVIAMWGAYIVKPLNLTNGYEIPALFIPFTAYFLTRALVKYNYLDSVMVDFTSALSRGQTGVLVIDRNHKVLYHNESMHKLFGEFHKYDDAFRLPGLEKAFQEKISTMELRGRTYEMKVEPVLEQGHHTGDIIWVYDMTQRLQDYDRAVETSTHDDLTGLYNRRWMEGKIQEVMNQSIDGAFFMVDLDRFKLVNDTYGHQVGDMALIVLAKILRNSKPKTSDTMIYPARLGGDEFCLFYQGETNWDVLADFSKKLIEDYDQELERNGYAGITSLSLGITRLDALARGKGVQDFATLYSHADQALYQAKEAGRRTYRFYESR